MKSLKSIIAITALVTASASFADVNFKFEDHTAVSILSNDSELNVKDYEHSVVNLIASDSYKEDAWSDVTIPLGTAAMDSISTKVALTSTFAKEANGLVNTSSAGLFGLFVIKSGLVYIINNHTKGEDRKFGLKATSGLWGAASANNLLLATGATGGVAIAGGVLAGVGMWYYEDYILDKDRQAREENDRIQKFYAY